MDPLRMIVAFVPLAAYLLLLGFLNLRRRPIVMSGARDSLLLGLGLFGLVLIGPLELLLPESTAFRFGGYVWLMLGCFYLLSLVLLTMMGQPRIVIYNSNTEAVRQALSRVAREMDEEARWAGDSVVLPTIGMQLCMQQYVTLRNVQLRSIGNDPCFAAWSVLQKNLQRNLKQSPSDRGACGSAFVMFAMAIMAMIAMTYLRDQGEIARSFDEMLRR